MQDRIVFRQVQALAAECPLKCMRLVVKHYLEEELGIHVRKVTHIFRVLAARDLDEAGIDDKVTMVSSFANVESCAMLLCKLCTMFLQQSAWLHPDRIEFSIWG